MATQEAFRFRDHDNGSVALSSTSWGVAQNGNASFNPARRFRLRVQVGESGSLTTAYKLQWRKNAGTFADVSVFSPGQSNLRAAGQIGAVEIVSNTGYVEQDATTDLLTGGTGSFVAGDGMETTITSGSIALTNQHTELEWSLWYHLYNDNAVPFFADGDTIEFRVVTSAGGTLTYAVTPTVTVDVPVGYIGFNPAESPGHMGPFVDSNGNLYRLVEISAHRALPLMVKSTDGGDAWAPVDAANSPTKSDLEGVDIRQEGDVLHVGHWATGGTDGIFYHRFNMSGHGTPDVWAVKDLVVDDNGGAGLTRRDQSFAMELLSNGDLRVFYQYLVAPCNIGMRSRISGTWDTSTTVVWSNTDGNWTGVTSVIDPATDIIYAFAKDDASGDLFGKAILANGTRQNLFADTETGDGTLVEADNGTNLKHEMNFAPPVLWNDGGTKKCWIAWAEPAADNIEGRRITLGSGGSVGAAVTPINDSGRVSGNLAQSRMPTMTVARDGDGVLHLIYARESTEFGPSELYHTTSDDDGATWSADTLVGSRSWGSKIAMVRAKVITHGGSTYLGYGYYDASLYEEDADVAALAVNDLSEFMGFVWYEQIALTTPATPFTGLILGSPAP